MIEYEDLRRVNQPFEAAFEAQLRQMLERGWYILGQSTEAFERAFAQYNGANHCVGVGSGLDALTLALRCADFPLGSEVIVPAHTFIATILSVLHAGLTPVLVEPVPQTYTIDPLRIEERLTSRTVAIIPVHLYGKCCAMEPILMLAKQYQLMVIEDCAQAHGARFKQRKAGSFGDFAAFSFYPTKNLGALGDGGAVITAQATGEARLRQLRNYGSSQKYYNEALGYNSRLDELQAAFLLVKLAALDAINEHKRGLAALYLSHLKDTFVTPVVDEDYYDVYHIFTIRHERRDDLRAYLLRKGIRTEIHYPVPPHRQKALQGVIPEQPLPITEAIHRTTLSLPISYAHSIDDIAQVIEALNKF